MELLFWITVTAIIVMVIGIGVLWWRLEYAHKMPDIPPPICFYESRGWEDCGCFECVERREK